MGVYPWVDIYREKGELNVPLFLGRNF